jgi:hypothetical protein
MQQRKQNKTKKENEPETVLDQRTELSNMKLNIKIIFKQSQSSQ